MLDRLSKLDALEGSTATFESEHVPTAPRVLFASKAEHPPVQGVLRARTLAEQMGAQVFMLRVVREQEVATEDPTGMLAVRGGELVDAVTAHAADMKPALIVLPHGECSGSAAVAIARATQRPVLMARDLVGDGTILAATDLTDPRFSLLAFAGQLGRRVEARVVALHNVERPRSTGRASAASIDPQEAASAGARFQELTPITRQHQIQTLVLTDMEDTVDAILAEAQRRGADLVVVGTAVRSEARARGRIAAHVTNLCPRSVLIVPWAREPVRPALQATAADMLGESGERPVVRGLAETTSPSPDRSQS